MNHQNQTPVTLHLSDIEVLKKVAVHAAECAAAKAATPAEIGNCVAALEVELRRINQLNGMQPEIIYRHVSRCEQRAFANWKKEQELKEKLNRLTSAAA